MAGNSDLSVLNIIQQQFYKTLEDFMNRLWICEQKSGISLATDDAHACLTL